MALLTVDGLNVATVYVDDFEQAKMFYMEILGFEVAQRMNPGVLLYSKGADLNLYLEGGRKPAFDLCGKGTHLSLCFNVAEGVKAARDLLVKNGIQITMEYGDENSAFLGIQFYDPSGNVLEIAGAP